MECCKIALHLIFLLFSNSVFSQPYKPSAIEKLLPVNFELSNMEDYTSLSFGLKNSVWESSDDEIVRNVHKQFYQTVFMELGIRFSSSSQPFDHTGNALYLSGSYQAKTTKGWFVEPSILWAHTWRLFHKQELMDDSLANLELSMSVGYDRSTFRESQWMYYVSFGYATELGPNNDKLNPKLSLGVNYLFYNLKMKKARKYCS